MRVFIFPYIAGAHKVCMVILDGEQHAKAPEGGSDQSTYPPEVPFAFFGSSENPLDHPRRRGERWCAQTGKEARHLDGPPGNWTKSQSPGLPPVLSFKTQHPSKRGDEGEGLP